MSLAATLAPPAPATAQDPLRVMIVDDAVVVRGLVSRWIDEEPGLKTVASLRNGREAVDQLTRHNPDVVLLDYGLPDLDGSEVFALIREVNADLPVIFATGHGDRRLLHDGLDDPHTRFLQKPFEIADLMAMMLELER